MKILVECHHAIGDVVMTFPALNNLRKLYPDAEIHYLGGMKAEIPLVLNTKNVEKVHIYNVKEQNVWDLAKLVFRLRKEHFDMGIAFGESQKGLDVLLLKLSGCKEVIATKKAKAFYRNYIQVDVSAIKHRAMKQLEVIKALGGSDKLVTNTIQVDDIRTQKVLERYGIANDARCIGLVLGTGNFMYRKGRNIIQYNTKAWAIKKFVELADYLVEAGYTVCLFGGKKEQQDFFEKKIEFSQNYVDFVGKLDILTMIAVMQRCRLVVGGDTGPMHCAAAAGVPTLTLFGPTDAELIGSLGEQAEYFYSDYECTKCYSECNEKGRTCKPAKCMEAIQVDDVYRKIVEMLD